MSNFEAGIVDLPGSSEIFIRGMPSISQILYTMPKAGCSWQVTRFVPMPKIFILWSFAIKSDIDFSFMSFEAIIMTFLKQSF